VIKKVLSLITVLLIFGLCFFLFDKFGGFKIITERETTDISVLIKKSFPISEVSIYQLEFQEILDDKKIKDLNIPFVGKVAEWNYKSMLLILQGTLKMGFDGQELKVSENNGKIVITVPKIRVLTSNFNSKVYSQKGKYSGEETINLTNAKKDEIIAKYENDEEYMKSAQESAKMFLNSIYQSISTTKNYDIEYEFTN